MAKGAAAKNYWTLLLLVLAGIVLGGFIGELTSNVSFLSWLNYGQSFGLSDPLVLNLGILVLTFGLKIKITIAGIIGILIAILIYRLLSLVRAHVWVRSFSYNYWRNSCNLRTCPFIVSRPLRYATRSF